MAIHLKRSERVVWKSNIGRNYRLLALFRDIILGILTAILFYAGLKEFGVQSKEILFWVCSLSFLMWLFLAAVNQISFLLISYVVTNERIIIKRGWLNRNLIDIPLDHVVSTEVKQSVQERVINSGTIYIKTANDLSTDGDRISNVDNPFRLNTIISEVIDEEEKGDE